jgi:hypothetical protein
VQLAGTDLTFSRNYLRNLNDDSMFVGEVATNMRIERNVFEQCLMGLSNSAAARSHFEQARDEDALPFRADSRINSMITQTGSRLAGCHA